MAASRRYPSPPFPAQISYFFTAGEPPLPGGIRLAAQQVEVDAGLVQCLCGPFADHVGAIRQDRPRRMPQENGQGFRFLFRRQADDDFHVGSLPSYRTESSIGLVTSRPAAERRAA